MINIIIKNIIYFIFLCFHLISVQKIFAQTHISADPFLLIHSEKKQFNGNLPIKSNIFRPIYFNTDSTSFSILFRSEGYYNDNVPNQENMDVRYFSKGFGRFHSIQFSLNSPYFSFLFEPYMLEQKYNKIESVNRTDPFNVLNDYPINAKNNTDGNVRNFLTAIHYKGFGFGWHKGNRWWGPGIHSSLQMTNNTQPFMGQFIGTIQEIKIGQFGLYALHSFIKLNEKEGEGAKYLTSLNAQLSWYGPLVLSLGISRNYLTGGRNVTNYMWSESDAKKIVFENLLTSNLIKNEYTVGGHDLWDQTLSGYVTITLPKRHLKIFAELGFNDNRMYFADFLSQPDHSMATIIGIRDYGLGKNKNLIWGFEWTNLMITYSSRHRPGGVGTWYTRGLYDFSSYKGRRWGAHSGADSDDWYLYAGYLSDKFMFIPAVNYERHGIVLHRPAEVKFEFRLDSRYKYMDTWFGIYYEKQFEAFLGFPDYYYVDDFGNEIEASKGKLANTRIINTLILSITRNIDF